jgi:arginine exporter protein ArgO
LTFNNSNKIIAIKFHTSPVQKAAMFSVIMTRNQSDFLVPLSGSTVLAMTLAASHPTFRNLIKTLGLDCIGLYGAEIWEITETNKKKLQAFQMDFLRRSCAMSRSDRVRNDGIKK